MTRDPMQSLRSLRDQLVEERRAMVATMLANPQTFSEAAGDFVGLQHFIDAVERAISHESVLDRPGVDAVPPNRLS